ncbi:DUF3300 domain-containing protein [Halovulum sp. GXIMD14794]
MCCTATAPVSAQVLVGDGSVTCGSSYTIAPGDTLSQVSARAYGDPQLYGFIADANWDAIGGNPENIAVGMELEIPCVDVSGEVLTPEQAAEAAASIEAAVSAEGPLTDEQLDTLFGPVALFPDAVLTPVLVAVTFPLDVMKAGRFVEETAELPDEQRVDQAAAQEWDQSVKELAAGFPELVTRMSENIDWTEQAGEAVVAQTDDVLASIQRLRAKAQENGYLVDNDAQTIEEEGDTIVISAADPNVVYVPTYDPQVVYNTPVVGTPSYYYGYGHSHYYHDDHWQDALIAGGIILGGAIILDEIFDDDDWDGWDIDNDIDWDRGDITIDRGDLDIDRGDINIGDGNRPGIGDGNRPGIGDGDRPQIGDGGRVSIGDSDRTQIDRSDLGAFRDGDRPGAETLPGNGRSISNATSRDAARKKIEARQSINRGTATLKPTRPTATQRATGGAARATSPSRTVNRGTSINRSPSVSRPSTGRSPTVRQPSRSNTFQRSGSRPSMSSNRGRSSAGRGGGGRGGRGGGRR